MVDYLWEGGGVGGLDVKWLVSFNIVLPARAWMPDP